MPSKQCASEREIWDREYSLKGELWRGRPANLPFLSKGCRVLELGCGNGKNMREMVRRGWTATGLDVSTAALDLCRKSLGQGDYVLLQGDARSLPFEDEVFDAVFALHILGHFLCSDRSIVMREAARVLAPGCLLFVQVFSIVDMRYGQGAVVEENTYLRQNGIMTHYFSPEELAGLAEKAGLNVEENPLLVKRRSRIGGKNVERAELMMQCRTL